MANPFWDERYRGDGYVYGTEPNDFLREQLARIPKGSVLCLAEGEGRNAVFLASHGYEVTGVDFSAEGLRKAARLARERGVDVTLIEADLASFELGVDRWSGIVSIWAHTRSAVRRRLHAQVARALVPGGAFVLEHYRPEQIPLGTGGPKDPDMLPTLAELRDDLAGLELVVAREMDRDVREGAGHGGPSATVQVVAVRR
ncbi:MAG: class I SAM-dependent methyltransferase [Acidobacteriota bacterium]